MWYFQILQWCLRPVPKLAQTSIVWLLVFIRLFSGRVWCPYGYRTSTHYQNRLRSCCCWCERHMKTGLYTQNWFCRQMRRHVILCHSFEGEQVLSALAFALNQVYSVLCFRIADSIHTNKSVNIMIWSCELNTIIFPVNFVLDQNKS